jgi:hypothetical protein
LLAGEDFFAVEEDVERAGGAGAHRDLHSKFFLQAVFEAHGLSFDAGSKEAALDLEVEGSHDPSIYAHVGG